MARRDWIKSVLSVVNSNEKAAESRHFRVRNSFLPIPTEMYRAQGLQREPWEIEVVKPLGLWKDNNGTNPALCESIFFSS